MTQRFRRSREDDGSMENVEKPVVIEDYNQHMEGVFFLLDVTLVNSHILHNIRSGSKINQLDFRLLVAKSHLQGFEQPRPRRSLSYKFPLRLTERPFPEPADRRG